MALDYSVEPSLWHRWKPALQNWRLVAFIGVFVLLFGSVAYAFLSFVLSNGVHPHGNYVSVDLKAMGQFPFSNQTGMLTDVPQDYRSLDGKRVELQGMMWSLQSAGPELVQFQLVYNIQKCCFNGPPQVQERVFVHMKRDKSTQWYYQLVSATGILHVRLKRNDQGTIYSVYDMDLESLEPT